MIIFPLSKTELICFIKRVEKNNNNRMEYQSTYSVFPSFTTNKKSFTYAHSCTTYWTPKKKSTNRNELRQWPNSNEIIFLCMWVCSGIQKQCVNNSNDSFFRMKIFWKSFNFYVLYRLKAERFVADTFRAIPIQRSWNHDGWEHCPLVKNKFSSNYSLELV